MNLCIMARPIGFVCGEVSDFFLSASVINAIDLMKLKMDPLNNELTNICKIFNPYEYVFSNVIDTPVSKLNAPNIYYELYEIFNAFSILKTLHHDTERQILHIAEELTGKSPFHLLFNTTNIIHCTIDNIETDNKSKLIFIDIGVNLVMAMDVIFRLLDNEGNAIIKLQSIYKKQTISVLYLLSIVFEKTFIVKPSIVNILSNDIFILCLSRNKQQIVYENVNLMAIDIPAVFLCKIEEFNSVNGHRQLDAYDQIFNLLHNRHRTIKLELLKKTNIQKSIGWCEKHNIPHNKVGDRVNMFL